MLHGFLKAGLLCGVVGIAACGYDPVRNSKSAPVPVPAPAPLKLVAEQKKKDYNIEGIFIPSNWMGAAGEANSGALKMEESEDDPFTGPTCQKWTYRSGKGTERWIAVGYSFPANNWGDQKGKDLSDRSFKRITFAARSPNQAKVIFKTGGGTKDGAKFPASYDERSTGVIQLTRGWRTYSIALPEHADLRNVVSIFCFASNEDLMDADTSVWFIDDIKLVED
jgi:hypothetical protein